MRQTTNQLQGGERLRQLRTGRGLSVEQLAFVCDGTVPLTLPESPYTLRRGNAISLATGIPQQWENTDSHAARVRGLNGRPASKESSGP